MALDNPKLLSVSEAVALKRRIEQEGGKLVLTNGVFDLLHAGHLAYLKKARKLAGKKGRLIVALNSDKSVKQLKGPLRPVTSERFRAFNLGQLQSVDGVIIFRGKRLNREIEKLRPDYYTKAGDYTIQRLDPTEYAALRAVGAKIKFMPFLRGFSTTGLIAKIKAAGEV